MISAARQRPDRQPAADDFAKRCQIAADPIQLRRATLRDAETLITSSRISKTHRPESPCAIYPEIPASAGSTPCRRHRLDDGARNLAQLTASSAAKSFNGNVTVFRAKSAGTPRCRHIECRRAAAGFHEQRIGMAVVATLELHDLVALREPARNRIADIVASVPEFTNRTFWIAGYASPTSCAKRISRGFGVPKLVHPVPPPARRGRPSDGHGRGSSAPRADVVDVLMPSTSQSRQPFARWVKNGLPPTPRNARTGEFTPPGKQLRGFPPQFVERCFFKFAMCGNLAVSGVDESFFCRHAVLHHSASGMILGVVAGVFWPSATGTNRTAIRRSVASLKWIAASARSDCSLATRSGDVGNGRNRARQTRRRLAKGSCPEAAGPCRSKALDLSVSVMPAGGVHEPPDFCRRFVVSSSCHEHGLAVEHCQPRWACGRAAHTRP